MARRTHRRYGIGVDIGGTKIAVSLGVSSGRIIDKVVFSSRGGGQPRQSLREIRVSIESLCQRHQVARREILGIGIAAAGAVDAKKGIINFSPHLKRWQGVAIQRSLERASGRPVFIENDANAAVLGEYWFGSGKGTRNLIYVTVSTGVGSGIVVDGMLVRGEAGATGEIGHMTMVPDGSRCACGKRGCLEAYASGTAIASFVRDKLKKRGQRMYHGVPAKNVTGALVSAACQEGDILAIQARERAARYLGIGLGNVIHLLNPGKIILGGGVMENVTHFWRPMMASIRKESWPLIRRWCVIERSRLGGTIGDVGALAVALKSR